MKLKITILLCSFLFAVIAASGQDADQKKLFAGLLQQYYGIRDGLVKGNPDEAAASALKFAETANTIDYKFISEGNINALLKDATIIENEKEIKAQRQAFAGLSENMIALVESTGFSEYPLYKIYCSMNKVNWLSTDKLVKNPYYGKEMLSCGEIIKTYPLNK